MDPANFLVEEGAGADPSQRIGTRLGGVVSSRDCRLVGRVVSHNRVKTVDPLLSLLRVYGTVLIGELLVLLTASAG